jgi:hypothetical protein
VSRRRPLEPPRELRQIPIASDEDRRRRCVLPGLGCAFHPGDPPVAAPVHGLDEARRAAGVPEHAPQLVHAADEHVLGHVDARPERLEQLVLGDELPRPGGQVLEDGERLAAQRHDLVAPVKPRICRVEREGPEANRAIAGHGAL